MLKKEILKISSLVSALVIIFLISTGCSLSFNKSGKVINDQLETKNNQTQDLGQKQVDLDSPFVYKKNGSYGTAEATGYMTTMKKSLKNSKDNAWVTIAVFNVAETNSKDFLGYLKENSSVGSQSGKEFVMGCFQSERILTENNGTDGKVEQEITGKYFETLIHDNKVKISVTKSLESDENAGEDIPCYSHFINIKIIK